MVVAIPMRIYVPNKGEILYRTSAHNRINTNCFQQERKPNKAVYFLKFVLHTTTKSLEDSYFVTT